MGWLLILTVPMRLIALVLWFIVGAMWFAARCRKAQTPDIRQ
ncbi:hypothetical protein V474_15665 [Novosphingobium barchaimii LL02]|uniref:Uncharacterized protein n=1 Tax=Novosphingobium barchaimii LL02 TaxID=1114963 RepID=A0A0J7XYU3_9SPHN|nr:hypothetical protein V474_15665 [Novosphingobium barchaimii LL02]